MGGKLFGHMSYCVTIPSWVVLPKRDYDPVVFYRVNVGIQPPDGATTSHGVLRRFNDFLKLFDELKKACPKKSFPPAPPKRLLHLKSRALLEEVFPLHLFSFSTSSGKCATNITVASFLELEVAARSSVQELNECSSKANIAENSTISSNNVPPHATICHFAGNSLITSDYGSDTAYETSELGKPRLGRDDSSEIGSGDLTLNEDLTGSIEELVKNEPGKVACHTRKLSTESVGSDVSSLRGSDMSIYGIPNSSVNGSHDLSGTAEILNTMGTLGNSDPQSSGRRLVTAKTDMDDLMARLNQEIAVKGYLMTKVKDLEVELGNTKQRSKENLQQAIPLERERFTRMQWEMEDLWRKSLKTELKLNPKRDEKQITETTNQSAAEDKDALLQELNATKEQLNDISKRYEELEAKSKEDIKVLVKEVKSLRKSQKEPKQEVGQSLSEKSEAEVTVCTTRTGKKNNEACKKWKIKLFNKCQLLHDRLLECSVNLSTDDENLIKDSSSVEALDLLATSDDKISLLLAEVPCFWAIQNYFPSLYAYR
ncbi:Adenine phosphoribosyltransferase 5 isoform 1 [Hibiscus syriacus]|uniref:Adenine phosphoribosyltransferase 5 isoform 1 n=1 Tax=Hibiscus syriacus TaxID=106335 RepID=A0A6A3D7I6_HIBSY|nr:Adenine phosphoribosyltransferase 5 isoform 1 [Hibiscus syriacus]